MADMEWEAADVLAGKKVPDDEVSRLCKEAMADAETVTLIVTGRNGQTVRYRILAEHKRTRMSVTQSYEQKSPPDRLYERPRELWAPSWKRTTWAIETRFDYRVEDFLGH